MKLKNSVTVLLVFGFFMSSLLYSAEVASISPEKPKWGETIRITYDPAAEGAAFLPGDEIYTVYYAYGEEAPAQRWRKMEKEGKCFVCDIPVEKGMAYLTFYFITPEKWDENSDPGTMIYKEDGTPARGAYHHEMMNSSKEEYLLSFEKEREFYPENFSIFRDKWFLMGALDKENQIPAIKKDMELMTGSGVKRTSGLLFSLSYGLMLLDNEKAARGIIRELAENHPQSYHTGNAINSYDYLVFSKKIQGEGPEEVNKLKVKLVSENPLSRYAREYGRNLVSREDVSFDMLAAVALPWMEEQPDNPLPYYTLALAGIKKKRNLDQVPGLLEKAINLILLGKLRMYSDVSGFLSQLYLPRCYQMRAEIYLQAENYALALTDIKTALSLEKQPRPDWHELEAKIWLSVNAFQNAERALLEADRLGSEEAKACFEKMYLKQHGGAKGFDEYYAAARKKHSSASSQDKKAAFNFDVLDLDGKPLRLADLKGKVVVLNFWFIGCAPCRVEMPSLNTLTDEFKEEDVVFIGFALDKADSLKKFLSEKAFNYRIVPSAGKIAAEYEVKVYPTHILINKEGRIEHFLTGGSDTRHEQLRPLIENLLR